MVDTPLRPLNRSVVLVLCIALSLLIGTTRALSPNTEYIPGTPRSSVVELTRATFPHALEDPANSLWLLKFYAPWCGHCKRMAPMLNEIAPELSSQLAIAKIDCTVQKALCSEYGVKGYPTLKFARDGKVYDYPGGRKKEDIVRFAKQMSAPAVVDCGGSYDSALELANDEDDEEELGIIFVVYHKDVKTIDDLQSTSLTQVFSQVARVDQPFAKFCLLSSTDPPPDLAPFWLNQEEKDKGFIAKLQINVPLKLLPLKEDEEVDTPMLLDFVKEYNVPLVSQLGPHNFHKIGRNGRRLVIGVIDGGADEKDGQIETMKKKLAEYALSGPTVITAQYYFGWIDGKQWQKFLQNFDVEPNALPQILALDMEEKKYWQNATYTSVKDFLMAIEDGNVEVKYSGRPPTGARGVLARAERTFFKYLPWSVVGVVAVICLMCILIIPTPDELREGVFGETKKAAAAAAAPEASGEEVQEGDESKKDK